MNATLGDWEVWSRNPSKSPRSMFAKVLRIFSTVAADTHPSFTWVLHRKSTGTVRRVTAYSEQEALAKIANGMFD
jgi:hypothetical protein